MRAFASLASAVLEKGDFGFDFKIPSYQLLRGHAAMITKRTNRKENKMIHMTA
jgi:hypothetical protein